MIFPGNYHEAKLLVQDLKSVDSISYDDKRFAYKFGQFRASEMHSNLRELFSAKAILVEK